MLSLSPTARVLCARSQVAHADTRALANWEIGVWGCLLRSQKQLKTDHTARTYAILALFYTVLSLTFQLFRVFFIQTLIQSTV